MRLFVALALSLLFTSFAHANWVTLGYAGTPSCDGSPHLTIRRTLTEPVYNPGTGQYSDTDFCQVWDSNESPCDDGSDWDQSSESCQGPCESREGEEFYVNFPDNATRLQNLSACQSGCTAAQFESYAISDGSIQAGFFYTGSQCEVGDPPPIPDPTPQEDPTPSSEGESTSTAEDGTVTETTEEKIDYNTTDEEGNQGKITEETKTETKTSPDGSSTTTETKTTTETSADGSKGVTTTETKTNCDPQGNCSTSVTGQSQYSEKPGEEEGEEGGTSTGASNCESPPVCAEGADDCALLQQQWALSCSSDFDNSSISTGIPEGEEDLTFTTVLADFGTRMEEATVIAGLDSFFDIGSGSGCPVWHASAGPFVITIDQFCSNQIPWALIQGMVIASALFAAARIAFT